MTNPNQITPSGNIASLVKGALGWWREAGIAHAFADDATDWLAGADGPAADTTAHNQPPAAIAETPAPPPPELARIGGASAQWPDTLAAFHNWWLTEPSLTDGPTTARVPPRGPAGAALMVLVAEPEPGDDGELLSGAQGRLLSAMLAAMRISPEDTYVASLLPARLPLADWGEMSERGLGEVALHHIGLVAPRRLVTFGGNVPPLLGHNPAQSAAFLQIVNHEQGKVPMLFARDLAFLLERPGARKGFWQQWLDWSA